MKERIAACFLITLIVIFFALFPAVLCLCDIRWAYTAKKTASFLLLFFR